MKHVKEEDLTNCPICDAVNVDHGRKSQCYRCQMPIYNYVYSRTEKSWAFLITAVLAYIPANIYPMLISRQFGHESGSTIMEGVLSLWAHGSYPIAAIIFIASIFVPILKFILLFYLLFSVKHPLGKDRKINRYKLHYITQIIGPWSMIDVFVIAILAGLIRFSSAEIIAGTAATAFAISVFFTLLSSHSFDVRLIK